MLRFIFKFIVYLFINKTRDKFIMWKFQFCIGCLLYPVIQFFSCLCNILQGGLLPRWWKMLPKFFPCLYITLLLLVIYYFITSWWRIVFVFFSNHMFIFVLWLMINVFSIWTPLIKTISTNFLISFCNLFSL